jgi:glyoxylase-like metal-dependent hydrolase (beta-lactamase superfamily II)
MTEIAPGLRLIDTMLGGTPRITSGYLVGGDSPALIDPGPETSAQVVVDALRSAGLGPHDLAWIVLTHIHLDHCGGTGEVAAAFPDATVVVHPRGVRHLADPARLVQASHAVYGDHAAMYGGLAPTSPERIVAAEDGHRVPVGPGRALEMIATPGHARHHMSVVDHATGAVVAGDACGAHLGGGRIYPTVPPADVDLAAGRASLARIAALRPTVLSLSHFGPAGDPAEVIATADAQLAAMADAVPPGYREGGETGIVRALEAVLPLEATVGGSGPAEWWHRLQWYENNIDGLRMWAEAQEPDPPA